MGTTAGHADADLIARAPGAELLALVRALRRAAGGRALRFSASTSMAFPAGDVERVEARGAALRVVTQCIGLAGTVSPLPTHLVEELDSEHDQDHAPRSALMDVFHHRAVELLLASVDRVGVAASVDAPGEDVWTQRVLMLARAHESTVPRPVLRAIAPLLLRRRTAHGLALALRTALALSGVETTVEIEELAGSRTPLAEEDRCLLGKRAHVLGQDALLGQSAADPAGRVIARMGPVSAAAHARLRPEGDLHALVSGIAALFDPAGVELALDVRLGADAHGARLADPATRLGRGAWLRARGRGRDPEVRDRIVVARATGGETAR